LKSYKNSWLAQCLSRRFSNDGTLGALTTSSSNLFHRPATLTVNNHVQTQSKLLTQLESSQLNSSHDQLVTRTVMSSHCFSQFVIWETRHRQLGVLARAIVRRCLRDPMFSRFGTTSACNRQTDGRTHDDSIYRSALE